MKQIVALGVILAAINCVPLDVSAQIYRVYRPVSTTVAPAVSDRRPYIELQAAPVISYGPIQDMEGTNISRFLSGSRGKVWVYLTPNVAVGVEGEKLKARDMLTELVSRIKREMWGISVRVNVTPQVNPSVYLLAGAGHAKYQTKFFMRPETLGTTSYILLGGIGTDIPIWKWIHIHGEYLVQYDTHLWHNAMLKGPHFRQEIAVGMNIQF